MKKVIVQFIFACILMQAVFTGSARGTTVVTINSVQDTFFYGYCPLPSPHEFICEGTATGYLSTDSISVYINFGDGHDTIIKSVIYSGTYFYADAPHTYYSAGTFSMECIATGPDLNADTLIQNSILTLADTCGNIQGKVYLDNNSNCVFDAGDSILRGYPVELWQGANFVAWSWSDINGDYWFNVPNGTYTIIVDTSVDFGFDFTCPSTNSYTITLSGTSYGNDFGGTCTTGFDMAGYIWGEHFSPGNNGWMYVSAYNLRCQPTSGTVKLIMDPLVHYVSSWWGPAPAISGDTLTWSYSNYINNYYYYYWWNWWSQNDFWNYLVVNTDSTAVLGDSVCFTLIVDPIIGDADPSNNTIHYCHVISNAWDPNYKEVYPKGVGANGDISATQLLTYNIHFQNTGTDTAYNISVYDTLDANIDAASFQPLSSDHTFRTEMLAGNVVKFSFDNILLPDSAENPLGSTAQITYTVKPKAGVADGTFIYNKAGIVFDYNAPVITNTVHNHINLSLGIAKVEKATSQISIYPNPSNSSINFHSTMSIVNSQLSIEDVLGNIIYNQTITGTDNSIDVSKWSEGVYFYEVRSNTDITRGKFVVEK